MCIQNVSIHSERFYSFRRFLFMENDSGMKNDSAMEPLDGTSSLIFLTNSLLESNHPLQSKKNDCCIQNVSRTASEKLKVFCFNQPTFPFPFLLPIRKIPSRK